ncbi:hypothetical protein BY996DRAFT_6468366 [Phakopsora pachyrhizi]|nr:hypothetical protein BY996DRAFT_6468366 [Phakopsora pachyrhizi]
MASNPHSPHHNIFPIKFGYIGLLIVGERKARTHTGGSGFGVIKARPEEKGSCTRRQVHTQTWPVDQLTGRAGELSGWRKQGKAQARLERACGGLKGEDTDG